jgi:UDP-N-acetylmuramoylalanine--D-glutamate ligase
MQFRGRRVVVMGLGRFGGGVAAARWLARRGAEVAVTDLAPASSLAESLGALRDVPIAHYRLAGHDEADFRRADWVVVNPAVKPDNPLLALARRAGARLTSEIELFLRHCPAPVVGVTGSNGKSTTAAMTAAALRADGRRAWLGGNLGGSLLEKLDDIRPGDWCVLELSSFQLHYLADDVPWPAVAVVTGFSPNHLDWHGSLAQYAAAKQRLLLRQGPDGAAVLNLADAEVARWRGLVRGRLVEPAAGGQLPPLGVPGEHNRVNAALAAAAARAAGCSEDAIRRGLAGFGGLPQRLEWVATVAGRRFYNDSAATTPESTAAALRSLDGAVWLLAGGRNKGFDLDRLAREIARRAAGAALFGATAEALRARLAAADPAFPAADCRTLDAALWWCWERSRPGEAILLSPGMASTDQFLNYQQRGERFVALVGALPGLFITGDGGEQPPRS